MENKELKHQKNKRTLRIIGTVSLVIGVICAIAGFVDFFIGMSTMEPPHLFFLLFIGFPLIAIGTGLLIFANHREITTFIKNESVPVINEVADEISPAITSVTKAVKTGIKKEEFIKCNCGTINSKNAKFCKKCGKPLNRVCPHCGASVDSDSEYCSNCGQKI